MFGSLTLDPACSPHLFRDDLSELCGVPACSCYSSWASGLGFPKDGLHQAEVTLDSLTHIYKFYVLEKGYLAVVGKHLGRSQAEARDRQQQGW